MRMTKTITMASLLLLLLASLAGCSSDNNNPLAPEAGTKASPALSGDDDPSDPDIVDVAIAAGFPTLVAAVQAADLEDALRSDGPFTVFAPTEDAFAKLPEGLVGQLLEPRNKEKLQELLLYHVVAGEVRAGDLRRYQFTKTLSEKYLWIRKFWGMVKVNNARVVLADVDASNGVIHAIDTVLIPRGFELEPEEAELDIVDTAANAGAFGTLLAAAGAAELVDALRGEGPLTVFAPTDDAFGMLPDGLVDALLMPENKGKLQELLLYHVVAGQVKSTDLSYYQRVETLEGSKVQIVKWFGNIWVNRSRVITKDVLATNGVIHAINRVLIPEGFSLSDKSMGFDKASLDSYLNSIDRQEAPPTEFDLEYLNPVN
jgi:transforming growth factor-beta-induced protein